MHAGTNKQKRKVRRPIRALLHNFIMFTVGVRIEMDTEDRSGTCPGRPMVSYRRCWPRMALKLRNTLPPGSYGFRQQLGHSVIGGAHDNHCRLKADSSMTSDTAFTTR